MKVQNFIYYLSGPITNNPNYLKDFNEAEAKLRLAGYTNLISPSNLNNVLHETATYEDYMDVCMMLLDKADAMIQLPGWEDSLGCQREYGYCQALEKPVIKLSDIL